MPTLTIGDCAFACRMRALGLALCGLPSPVSVWGGGSWVPTLSSRLFDPACFMSHFRLFAHWLGVVFEKFRGQRQLSEITSHRRQIESLMAHSVDGYATTIHCQERRYICSYQNWWIPNRVVRSYYVFATVQGTAPKPLVEACAMDRSFPPLLHSWMPPASQKEAAIEAYIDLLVERLEKGITTAMPNLPGL